MGIALTDDMIRDFALAVEIEVGDDEVRIRRGMEAAFARIEKKVRRAASLTQGQKSDLRRMEAKSAPFNGRGFRGPERLDVIAQFMVDRVLEELSSE